MKKVLIGAGVAAIIVFVYQAMSWMVLPVHTNTLKYSAQQDAILTAMSENLTEDGVYAIPNLPPGSTQEQHTEFSNNMIGMPSAVVHFHKSFSMNMGMQMGLGFLLNLVSSFLLAYVMWTARDKFVGFGPKLLLAVVFAAFTVLNSSLMMANWWNTPMHYLSGEIIDHLVGWGLGGAWLAWWLGRKQTTT